MEKFVLVPLSLWNSKQNIVALDKTVPTMNYKEKLPTNLQNPTSTNASVDIHDQILKTMTGHLYSSKSQIIKLLLANPRITLSTNYEIILDGTNTEIEVRKFINDLMIKGGNFPDLYAAILDILKIPSHLIKNKNALQTHRGDWIPWRK